MTGLGAAVIEALCKAGVHVATTARIVPSMKRRRDAFAPRYIVSVFR
ncbi:hypothetical protein [Paracoccus alkanivorans]|nr:hypothetical protein [Paracoccus alkanivorans]